MISKELVATILSNPTMPLVIHSKDITSLSISATTQDFKYTVIINDRRNINIDPITRGNSNQKIILEIEPDVFVLCNIEKLTIETDYMDSFITFTFILIPVWSP
jgi:hypothetical protein